MARDLPSFVRTGDEEPTAGRKSPYVSLKDGDTVDLAFLTDRAGIISFDQHSIWLKDGNSPMFPCLKSKDCPGCMIKNDPRFKAVAVVQVKGEEEQKILVMGLSLARAIFMIDDTYSDTGGIKNQIVRVSRTGKGMKDTKYNAIPTGKQIKPREVEIDLIDHIGPLNREDIIELLRDAGVWEASPAEADEDLPWDSEDFDS